MGRIVRLVDLPRIVDDVEAPRFEEDGLRVIEEVSCGRVRGTTTFPPAATPTATPVVEPLGTLCPGRVVVVPTDEIDVDLAAATGFFIV